MAGEQQRLSNSEEKEEDRGEEQTEQHDKDTQPALVTEHNDEEKQTAAIFCEKDVVFPFASQYNCSTEDLQYEIPQLKRILERKQSSGQVTPKALIELTVFLEPFKEVFHQMFKLCKIALALPVSTASCERSFSKLKLIKTALRSTMTDERLSNLGVLSVESRRARAINLDDFVDVFAKKHSNRRIKLF